MAAAPATGGGQRGKENCIAPEQFARMIVATGGDAAAVEHDFSAHRPCRIL
jgi:hypothetical protein